MPASNTISYDIELKKITSYIPNSITSLNLLSGCLAVIMAFRLGDEYCGLSAQSWAWIFIGAAAVFDFCDGLSARLLKAYSDMGKELDSLSDLVSFGVAPGMLMFNLMQAGDAGSWAFAALLIPVLGGLRLAKFNVDDSQATTFTGLPIPANAIFWIGVSAWISDYGFPPAWILAIVILAISLAMVCPLRMFSLKFKTLGLRDNIKRYALILAAVAFVAVNGLSGLAWTIILYILLSAFGKRSDDEE